jgi:hypothetical protein
MAATRTAPAINTVYDRFMPDHSPKKPRDLNALAREIVDEPTCDTPTAPDQPLAVCKLTHYREERRSSHSSHQSDDTSN